MKTDYLPQPALMERAINALISNLGIAKASEFWSGLGYGKEDYAKLRKKMFLEETIENAYKKIESFEKKLK